MTMTRHAGTPLIDAATTLVGWINYSATDPFERTRVSGEVVRLSTMLDASSHFTLVASHPGHSVAVTVVVELAPVLRDGTMGSWIAAATVAIPAEGGRIETMIGGHGLSVASADLDDVDLPALCFARASVSPATPNGCYVGLTATVPA
jgi:hypothetical protein